MKSLRLSPSLAKLVTLLNDGEYHDGTTLGDELNMTRSAVWKLIKKLESYDVKIDSIKGKGYALQEPLILFNKNIITKHLTKPIDMDVFESVDSTNEYLKRFFNSPTP